jgi:hypothetical protein
VDRHPTAVEYASNGCLVAFPLYLESVRGCVLLTRGTYVDRLTSRRTLFFYSKPLAELGYDPVDYSLDYPQADPAETVMHVRGLGGRLLLTRAADMRAPYNKMWRATVVIPMWLLILPSLPIPLLRIRRFVRAATRRRSGRCIQCGYDLRASTKNCPECGSPIVNSTVRRTL